MITNRSPLKVSTEMLRAGANALEDSRNLGHDARTTAHLVFLAMLAESQWSPAVRKRPQQADRALHSPAEPIAHYRGKLLGAFEWRGFNTQDGRHYFSDGRRWIRITDEEWNAANLNKGISRSWYDVPASTAMGYLKRKSFTLS